MQNYIPQPYRPYPNCYKAIPIANESEMSNITVDFNGTPTYFHNQMTNEIFVKQFDIKTGLTSIQKFIKFEADSKPNNEDKNEDKVNLLEKQLDALNSRIDSLKSMFEKGGKNVKQRISDDD